MTVFPLDEQVVWSERLRIAELTPASIESGSSLIGIDFISLSDPDESVVGYRILYTDDVDADLLLVWRDFIDPGYVVELSAGLGRISASEASQLRNEVLSWLSDLDPAAGRAADEIGEEEPTASTLLDTRSNPRPPRRFTVSAIAFWASGADTGVAKLLQNGVVFVSAGVASITSAGLAAFSAVYATSFTTAGWPIQALLGIITFVGVLVYQRLSAVTVSAVSSARDRPEAANGRQPRPWGRLLPRWTLSAMLAYLSAQFMMLALYHHETSGAGLLHSVTTLNRLTVEHFELATQFWCTLFITLGLHIAPALVWLRAPDARRYRSIVTTLERQSLDRVAQDVALQHLRGSLESLKAAETIYAENDEPQYRAAIQDVRKGLLEDFLRSIVDRAATVTESPSELAVEEVAIVQSQ